MPDADICICMPVWQGADLLPETVRSIRAQEYEGWRAIVSVDGDDRESLAACRVLMGDDPRFEVVLQERSLGWPGNFNWTLERADLPFAIYWQQDDFCSHDYLGELRAALLVERGAAVAACDVQRFGLRAQLDRAPEYAGTPLARVLEHAEQLSFVPLRGLLRRSLLPPAPAIPNSRDRSAQEEFMFLGRLAAAGDVVRVPGPLYYKRVHAASETLRMTGQPEFRLRRETAHLAAGLLALAQELAPAGLDGALLAWFVDRFTVFRPGRQFFWHPPDAAAGARHFLLQVADEAAIELADPRWRPAPAGGLERPVHPAVLAALESERRRAVLLSSAEPPLAAWLGWGWHPPEPWGAWSSGEHASVELGHWRGGRLRLEGRVYAPAGPVRVGWSLDGDDAEFTRFAAGEPVMLEVEVPEGAHRLQLHLPDAIAPVEAGVSADPRRLGLGLERCAVVG